MADDDSSGSKYAYLLQPIKDLEKNFAIDLVSLLETYTQELGDLAEAEEFQRNNAHRFNFAEAGMLIHGSAAVLAKKVDLVHSHALNFFQVLQNAKPKKKNHDSDDGDEGIGGDDDDDPFTAATIDPCVLKDCSRLKTTNLSSLVSKNPNTAIPSISIMPMSLMPLADFEKCNVPIYNSKNKNEVVGKKDDFKINTGYMSRSGALLLDLLNEALVDQFMTQQQKMPESSGEDSGRCSPVDDPASEMNLPQLPCSQEFDSGRPSNAVEIVRRAAGPSMDVAQIPRPSSVFLNADGKPSQPLEVLAEANFSDMDTGGGFDDNDVTPTPLVRKADPWDVDDMEIDPLLELHDDPFEEVLWKSKPYNKSNNCLNLEAILARRKKADERKDRKEKLMETIEFVNDEIYCLGKKQKIKRQIGLGTQYKWEIDAILPYISNQQKRRDKVRREMLAQRRLDEKLALRGKKNPRALPEFDEDDDYADGFDDEPTHFCDNAPNYVPAETISRPLMATVDDADLAENIAFPAIIYDPASQNSEAGAHVNRIVHDEIHEDMTLEEIITFYRKKYWEQTAEAMSKLAARVQEWDEKMQPLLEEEETRKEFSIHAYGTELLAFFNKLDDVRTLPELLKGKVNYEISRYFLSTLMMANTMNLEIINEQQMGPDPLKMMRMKLLTRERHHEIFEGNGDL